MLVCNEEHRFLVAEQLREIEVEASRIILEPEGRNTAPAVALAAHEAMKADDDAILVVLPSDHVIQETGLFLESLSTAIDLAKDGALVTFGVVPDKPETGYGYIKKGAATGAAFKVDKFVEKPDLATAEKYIASGDYYWNSGMFVFKASVYLAALEKANPYIIKYCQQSLTKAKTDLDFIRIDPTSFEQCPDDSIDYVVMDTSSVSITT